MNTPSLFFRAAALVGILFLADPAFGQTPPAASGANPTAPVAPSALKDAEGRTLRRAPTGHLTNYYEEKVSPYTLPDPLVLADGQPVRDAGTWFKQRRPEILKLYETEIYGHVPGTAPKVRFEVLEKDVSAFDGLALRKHLVGHFGEKPGGPEVTVMLYVPAKATGPVPLVLHITFNGDPLLAPPLPGDRPVQTPAGQQAGTLPATAPTGVAPPRRFDMGPVAEIISHGYAYAILRYTEIQPDTAAGRTGGVMSLALVPGQTAPAPGEWGTISAWAWGLSRIVDYLETDSAVDAKRIALVGHSRLGKTVLWAGATDSRYALIYSSQGGEMGSALSRRDYGETVDDMAANFGYQFAGNFQKYPGHWNDLPVDAHLLISLSAPRPVLVSGGSGDPWSDPRGEFLAMVAAGPVWKLLGQSDLGTTEMPALDVPVATGTLAFLNHDGPHAITPLDWKTFLEFADRFLQPKH